MELYTVFLSLLNMSVTAGLIILLILPVRLCLKKAPKVFSYLLWSVALFRLLCPGVYQVADLPRYHYLSLIPLDRKVTGVTLRGTKYPLDRADLTRGDTLSISNEPAGPAAEITIASGRALLIRSQRA